jgi:hypothetical protein
MKPCNVCHQEKGLDQFYRDAAAADGLTSTCKPCTRQRAREWRNRNPRKVKEQAARGNAKARANPRPPATEGTKTCSVCKQEKPVTEFYILRAAPDGRGYACKPCAKEQATRWNAENRDRFNANQRRSRSARADDINARRRVRENTDAEYRERRAAERQRYLETPEGQANLKQYREAHRERVHLAYVLRTFNLSADDYQALRAKAKGRCPICKREPDEWVIDHDHSCCPGKGSCGKCVRGMLCAHCNWALGHFEDDPERCRAAVRYLAKYKS